MTKQAQRTRIFPGNLELPESLVGKIQEVKLIRPKKADFAAGAANVALACAVTRVDVATYGDPSECVKITGESGFYAGETIAIATYLSRTLQPVDRGLGSLWLRDVNASLPEEERGGIHFGVEVELFPGEWEPSFSLVQLGLPGAHTLTVRCARFGRYRNPLENFVGAIDEQYNLGKH